VSAGATATAVVSRAVHADIAARVLRRIAAPVIAAHQDGAGRPLHLPGQLDAQWAAGLPLPLAEQDAGQQVTLADAENMVRLTDRAEVAAAYRQRPRTRILEAVSLRGGWHGTVADRLAAVFERQVIGALFESNSADEHFGPHADDWWGLVLQLRGCKTWQLWPQGHGCGTPLEITTSAGDLLMLPRGMVHAVSTPGPPEHPGRPGYSVHLAYAVLTGPPEAGPVAA
jgi:hypothetical protein